MELLEGRELTRLMQPRVPLRPAAVVPLIQQIARGLSAAHAKGIVHRDLKPSNVFLMAGAGGSESVKLLDFGISKVRHESGELTATNSIMGTPHYMSPEQANGRTSEATERADQFALAAIAYEMLSGHRAFPGDEPVAVLYRVVHQQPPDLLSRVPVLPRALEEVVSRGLAKRAEDRFPSVSAFAEAFTTAAGVDDPVRRPPLGALPAQGGHIVQGDTLRSATHLRPSESQRQLARWGRRRTVAVLSATSLAAAFAVAVTAKSHGSRSAVGRGPNPTSLSGVVAEQPTRHPPTTASVLRSSTLAPSTAVERDERVARGVLRAPATKRRKSDIARATSVDTPSTTPKPEDRPVHNEEL
jgi:serine/threonine-protein kinase